MAARALAAVVLLLLAPAGGAASSSQEGPETEPLALDDECRSGHEGVQCGLSALQLRAHRDGDRSRRPLASLGGADDWNIGFNRRRGDEQGNTTGPNSTVNDTGDDNTSGGNTSGDNASGDNASGSNASGDNASGGNASGDNRTGRNHSTASPRDSNHSGVDAGGADAGGTNGTGANATPSGAECAASPGCAALLMTGLCCPNADGFHFSCCASSAPPAPEATPTPAVPTAAPTPEASTTPAAPKPEAAPMPPNSKDAAGGNASAEDYYGYYGYYAASGEDGDAGAPGGNKKANVSGGQGGANESGNGTSGANESIPKESGNGTEGANASQPGNSTAPAPPPAPPPAPVCAERYKQCGGEGWKGLSTCCEDLSDVTRGTMSCAKVNKYYSMCVPGDEVPFDNTAEMQTPSGAALETFYIYRAFANVTYEPANVNVANLAGVMWYLHHEVVITSPRKFGIAKIARYKIKMRPPKPLFDAGMKFGVRFAFDIGRCTGPWYCGQMFQKYGYFVGCNKLGDFPYPDFPTSYAKGIWYSLPGACPLKYLHRKDDRCTASQPGGRCSGVPTGTGTCTYDLEEAGEIDLDELLDIDDYDEFLTGGSREYDPLTDKGVGLSFWNGINDTNASALRVQKASALFSKKYPDDPEDEDMPSPECDFDFEKFYGHPYKWHNSTDPSRRPENSINGTARKPAVAWQPRSNLADH